MDCKKAKQLWHDQRDEGFSPTDQAALELHLSSCPSCQRYHDQMNAMNLALDRLRDDSHSVGISAEETTDTGRRPSRWMPIWYVGRIAAALALIVGAGLMVTHHGRNSGLKPTPGPGLTGSEHHQSEAIVALNGPSDVEFIAVPSETTKPNVHVFWLYQTGEKTNNQPASSGVGD